MGSVPVLRSPAWEVSIAFVKQWPRAWLSVCLSNVSIFNACQELLQSPRGIWGSVLFGFISFHWVTVDLAGRHSLKFLYVERCARCHGQNGGGHSQRTSQPVLTNRLAVYGTPNVCGDLNIPKTWLSNGGWCHSTACPVKRDTLESSTTYGPGFVLKPVKAWAWTRAPERSSLASVSLVFSQNIACAPWEKQLLWLPAL